MYLTQHYLVTPYVLPTKLFDAIPALKLKGAVVEHPSAKVP